MFFIGGAACPSYSPTDIIDGVKLALRQRLVLGVSDCPAADSMSRMAQEDLNCYPVLVPVRRGPHSRSDVVRCLELLLDLGAVWDNTAPALIGGAKSTIVNTSYRRSCPQLNIRPSASCGEYWNRELAKCKTSERS